MSDEAYNPPSQRTTTRRNRVRPHRRKQALLGAERPLRLRPAEQPPNYDGMDLSELPPMHEAILTEPQARALFSDIERCASDIHMIARRGAGSPKGQVATLKLAAERFLAGQLNKLQIRYRWQAARWIDTLEQSSSGIRLVRIRHGDG